MGLRVNTNVLSLSAQRNLSTITQRLAGNYARLSSGLRIVTAADDAAGLAISERMRAQIVSLHQNERNALDGVSLIQVAEGALMEDTSNLIRMRALAIQAANGTLNTGDRAALQSEFLLLIEEIDRIADQTDFNGILLLNSASTVDIQVGTESGEVITITLVDTTDVALGLTAAGFDLTTVTNASLALGVIDTAIDSVADARSDLGAAENRMQSALRSIRNTTVELSAAESRIRDVDVAFETADLTRNTIMQQAAIAVVAQANLQPQIALSLLQ